MNTDKKLTDNMLDAVSGGTGIVEDTLNRMTSGASKNDLKKTIDHLKGEYGDNAKSDDVRIAIEKANQISKEYHKLNGR